MKLTACINRVDIFFIFILPPASNAIIEISNFLDEGMAEIWLFVWV